MAAAIPEFGVAAPGVCYVLRPGGYVILLNALGEVATVATPLGLALPGGGQDGGEDPQQAAIREAQEECGLRIALGRCLGVADELVFATEEGQHFRKRCTFFDGEVIGSSGAGEPDHQLLWLPAQEALALLRHESQRWAVAQSQARTNGCT